MIGIPLIKKEESQGFFCVRYVAIKSMMVLKENRPADIVRIGFLSALEIRRIHHGMWIVGQHAVKETAGLAELPALLVWRGNFVFGNAR